MHQRWKKNVQHGGGAFIPCVWEIQCKEDCIDEVKGRIELAIVEMEGEGLDMAIEVSYPIFSIYGQSRQREGRELFRYCFFYLKVLNHSRRCFGPNHASLMQTKQSSVTALRLEHSRNLFIVNLYNELKMNSLLLFRFYFIQIVEQAASPASKKMKPE